MRTIAAIAVLLLVLGTCAAQDLETSASGRAQVGGPGMGEAWLQNPAFLGLYSADGATDGAWKNAAAGMYEWDGDVELRTLSWCGYPGEGSWGIGAGWTDVVAMSEIGVGFGMKCGKGLSFGLNYQSIDVDIAGVGDSDVFDLGVAGTLNTGEETGTATWGFVARDIADEVQTTYDIGMALDYGRWTLALDLEDITDENEMIFQIGGRTSFGERGEWTVAAGLDDGDPTAGIIYSLDSATAGTWKLGVVWHEGDEGASDSWLVGASTVWGG